jgi:hypothetical protein
MRWAWRDRATYLLLEASLRYLYNLRGSIFREDFADIYTSNPTQSQQQVLSGSRSWSLGSYSATFDVFLTSRTILSILKLGTEYAQ